MSEKIKQEDGFDWYLIELDIVGIRNRVFMEAPGENIEDAVACVLESITQIKSNDCEFISASKILELGEE